MRITQVAIGVNFLDAYYRSDLYPWPSMPLIPGAEDTWRRSLNCLKRRGMFISFGQSSGTIAVFKPADLAAGGSLFASRPTLFDNINSREELQTQATDLFARLSVGEILQTHIGQWLPLCEAADAHRALASRRAIGATVLLAS